jgi:hypothetical protein
MTVIINTLLETKTMAHVAIDIDTRYTLTRTKNDCTIVSRGAESISSRRKYRDIFL